MRASGTAAERADRRRGSGRQPSKKILIDDPRALRRCLFLWRFSALQPLPVAPALVIPLLLGRRRRPIALPGFPFRLAFSGKLLLRLFCFIAPRNFVRSASRPEQTTSRVTANCAR